MEPFSQPGGDIWAAEAPNWLEVGGAPLLVGVTQEWIKERARLSLKPLMGQMYGVVGPGLIMTQHVFRGLSRHMYVRDDMRADASKLALVWPAKRDATWVGDEHNGRIEYHPPPADAVFVVYVSPNRLLKDFPSVFGWAEHWTWVDTDPMLPGAPIDWSSRYEQKVWSSHGR